MQKIWQKKFKLDYNKEKIIDIIQFGSSIVVGTDPNDIDIAVIFNKLPLKEQLIISQDIKQQLKKDINLEVHMSSMDYYSLFDNSNFAREGILFYGKSLLTEKPFSNLFGLEPKIRIRYSLNNLDKKDKVKFNYLLNGRQGKYGLLRKYSGSLIAPGIIELPPEFENIFFEKMKNITDKIEVDKIFKII